MKKLQHSKRKDQQNEKETYRMEKNICKSMFKIYRNSCNLTANKQTNPNNSIFKMGKDILQIKMYK